MSKTIKEVIFEAVGEASMCWMPRPEGVFMTSEAQNVAERATNEVVDIYLNGRDQAFGLGHADLTTKLQTILDHLDVYSGRGEMTDKAYHIVYDKVMAIVMDLTKDIEKPKGSM